MGVVGLTRLLQEEGWLLPPEDGSCLWRSENVLDPRILERIQRIPSNSTLAVDGNSLAFHLHRVAYTRHYQEMTTSGSLRTQQEENTITALLPHCMPLGHLHQITTEFVKALTNADMILHLYWDGPVQRFKNETMGKRTKRREEEWSALQMYCHYGVLPFSSCSAAEFLQHFPFSKLWISQIRHSLQQLGVSMEFCKDEADVYVARASARGISTFAVGNDSDYCVYDGIQYVPLETLQISQDGSVSGIVMTRNTLAESLDLPTARTLVELALWMGNDYVTQTMVYQLDQNDELQREQRKNNMKKSSIGVHDKIQWIQTVGSEFFVASSDPDIQLALDYARSLYDLLDVTAYPMEISNNAVEGSDSKSKRLFQINLFSGGRIKLQPMDISLRAVACRQLQEHLDQLQFQDAEDEHGETFTPQHLEAFQQLNSSGRNNTSLSFRPEWTHVIAAFVIEGCLAKVIRSNQDASVVKLTPPYDLFHHLKYYAILKAMSTNISTSPLHNRDVCDKNESLEPQQQELPIDEYEDQILETVRKQRVTIIQGATGCGKSSRVPVMLLRSPPPPPPSDDSSSTSNYTTQRQVKLFISQPRRIAAKSLVERVRSCEPDLKNAIALRMGHGVREYESSSTRAWFVTTGYLVRLLASHPEKFRGITYLVVDEVHERSVDTDILCLLCRRLLSSNGNIRLVLMSATMAATLYQQYFGVPEGPIHVGARRFPIQEYFVEDLSSALTTPLPPNLERAVSAIVNDCQKRQCREAPPTTYMESLCQLAVHVTMCVGRPGSSVLIFVPGMVDIVSITDMVERLHIPPIHYVCYPIHSDVPFEEQLAAFDSPGTNEVKVVIATNAAESSVTLPDVDHVICLGLCKQIVYNPRSHRQALQPCWISRASAVQRAGRTGRVREGHVYRLYPRVAMEKFMQEFEPGEMVRIPLDSVILSLKEMLKEEATPALLQCLEPPDLSTIDRSFKSLCRSNFLTQPNDSGDITRLGSFVIALGVDLMLGSLIGLGIQFGVGPEAIELVAILAFPKTPWLISNPLFHDSYEYNDITARTFVSKCHFDACVKSEPFAVMNLIWDYERVSNKNGWCRYYSLSAQRVRRLVATKKSIQSRVADYVGIDPELLLVEEPPVRMHHAKLTILRVLQVWVFSEGLIECPPFFAEDTDEVTWPLSGATVTTSHFEEVLDAARHPFKLTSLQTIEQFGTFTPVDGPLSVNDFSCLFLVEFEHRFISYALEKKFDLFWCQTDDSLRVYAVHQVAMSPEFDVIRQHVLAEFEEISLFADQSSIGSNQRGRRGRACGIWSVHEGQEQRDSVQIFKWYTTKASRLKKVRTFRRIAPNFAQTKPVLSCMFSRYAKNEESPSFCLTLRGNCTQISGTDVRDLFATPYVEVRLRILNHARQSITFPDSQHPPLPEFDGKTDADTCTADVGDTSSWKRPLVHDIPEGARLLSVLASGRRKDHFIRLGSLDSDNDMEKTEDNVEEESPELPTLDIGLPIKETKLSHRWRQFGTMLGVYVSENSVPAATVAMKDPKELFACCANILELRGGAVKAEGLTLLPPGRLFVLLSLLTFGLQVPGLEVDDSEEKKEETVSDDAEEINPLALRMLQWLRDADEESLIENDEKDLDALIRIRQAQQFHKSCETLGEELICYPKSIKQLTEIFDAVDGYTVVPWDNIDANPLTAANMRKHKQEREARRLAVLPSRNSTSMDATGSVHSTRRFLRAKLIEDFSIEESSLYSHLFAVELPEGETVSESELPTTNILCILLRHYRTTQLEGSLTPEARITLEERWQVHSVRDSRGKEWFVAALGNTIMPVPNGSARTEPGWVAAGWPRPTCTEAALDCIPPTVTNVNMLCAAVSWPQVNSQEQVVLFDTVNMAFRMEAAFWLERQFREVNRHWYQHSLDELMTKATALLH